jgi:hypothetical protein
VFFSDNSLGAHLPRRCAQDTGTLRGPRAKRNGFLGNSVSPVSKAARKWPRRLLGPRLRPPPGRGPWPLARGLQVPVFGPFLPPCLRDAWLRGPIGSIERFCCRHSPPLYTAHSTSSATAGITGIAHWWACEQRAAPAAWPRARPWAFGRSGSRLALCVCVNTARGAAAAAAVPKLRARARTRCKWLAPSGFWSTSWLYLLPPGLLDARDVRGHNAQRSARRRAVPLVHYGLAIT